MLLEQDVANLGDGDETDPADRKHCGKEKRAIAENLPRESKQQKNCSRLLQLKQRTVDASALHDFGQKGESGRLG